MPTRLAKPCLFSESRELSGWLVDETHGLPRPASSSALPPGKSVTEANVMESQSCPDMHAPLGACGRNADVWGAENMGCREDGAEEWVEVVLLWASVGWTLFFLCLFFFFIYFFILVSCTH